jgi:hypothetical protein
MDDFRVPFSIPQDLLLIQELVAETRQPFAKPSRAKTNVKSDTEPSNLDSSDSLEADTDSEDEVENLVFGKADKSSSSRGCVYT